MEGNGNQFLEFDGYIDIGKELASLHVLLVDNLESANKVDNSWTYFNNFCDCTQHLKDCFDEKIKHRAI